MPKYLTANGETHTYAEWGRKTGIAPATIGWRVKKGLTPEQVVGADNLPSAKKKKTKNPCRGCAHWKKLFQTANADCFCSYLLDTGHMRGCKADECMRYQKKKKGGS